MYPCDVCSGAVSRSQSLTAKFCPVCNPGRVPGPPKIKDDGRLRIWTDASYAHGVAGLAIVGSLGEHWKRVKAPSSSYTEIMAMRWALQEAYAAKLPPFTRFYTDCGAVIPRFQWIALRDHGWIVKQISRTGNRRADYLAGKARLNPRD